MVLEQFRSAHQPRTYVEDHEQDRDQRRQGSQGSRAVVEAGLEEFRNGERIARLDRVASQPLGQQRPAQPDANHRARRNPPGDRPADVGERREREHRPGAGGRRTGAQGGREAAQPPRPEHVIGHVAHLPRPQDRDPDQEQEVGSERRDNPRSCHRAPIMCGCCRWIRVGRSIRWKRGLPGPPRPAGAEPHRGRGRFSTATGRPRWGPGPTGPPPDRSKCEAIGAGPNAATGRSYP